LKLAVIKIGLTTGLAAAIMYILHNSKELGTDKPSVFASILNLAVDRQEGYIYSFLTT
jgi:hypothetical protein